MPERELEAKKEEEEVLIERDGKTLFDGRLEGWENTSEILSDDYGSYEVTLKDANETIQLCYLHESLSRAFGVQFLHHALMDPTRHRFRR